MNLGLQRFRIKELKRLSNAFLKNFEGDLSLDGYTHQQWKLLRIGSYMSLWLPNEVKWRGDVDEIRETLLGLLIEEYKDQITLFGDEYIDHFMWDLYDENEEKPVKIHLNDLIRMRDAKALIPYLRYLVTDIPESMYAEMDCDTKDGLDIVFRAVATDKMVTMEPAKTKLRNWTRDRIFKIFMDEKETGLRLEEDELWMRRFCQ